MKGNISKSIGYEDIFNKLGSLQDSIKEYIDIDSPPLLWISMRLTLVCNLRCPFCSASSLYQGAISKPDLGKYSIPLNIAKKALNDASKLGALILEITGGEPFLYPHIIELLKYADDLGFEITIATNATKIDRIKAQALSKMNSINNIQISLDGATEQTHDSIRGKGVYKRVMETVKLLKEYNVPFSFNTVLSRLNVHELDKILRLALDVEARGIRVSFVAKFGRGAQIYNRIALSFNEIIKIRDRVYEFYKEHRGRIKIGIALPLLLVPDEMKYDFLNFKTTSSCNILTYMGVNFDGTVGPCTYMLKPLREYVLGNLFKENLIKIWQSSKFKKFRMQVLEELNAIYNGYPCKYCRYKVQCMGNCVAETYNETMGSRFVRPNSYCIAYVQTLEEEKNMSTCLHKKVFP